MSEKCPHCGSERMNLQGILYYCGTYLEPQDADGPVRSATCMSIEADNLRTELAQVREERDAWKRRCEELEAKR
jgi:hypothetical protein